MPMADGNPFLYPPAGSGVAGVACGDAARPCGSRASISLLSSHYDPHVGADPKSWYVLKGD